MDNQHYTYNTNVLADEATRLAYFQLTKQIFRLDFEKWYQSGYWDNCFVPYLLMHEGKAVSSVAVCINDISWQGQQKRYVQISTVMTLPEYRNRGLNRQLMETVISEWKDKCDAIYLLANDSVVDFYPKFGFERCSEFQYSMPIVHAEGLYRKLDVENENDWALIMEKYKQGNPFSALNVDNKSQFVFHCLYTFSNDLYYVDKYEALVIARQNQEKLICFDIFTEGDCHLEELLNMFATESTTVVYLGFTPKHQAGFMVEVLQEADTHLFVLECRGNVFKDNKVMFPKVSRA